VNYKSLRVRVQMPIINSPKEQGICSIQKNAWKDKATKKIEA
jgi:hypothetical protein